MRSHEDEGAVAGRMAMGGLDRSMRWWSSDDEQVANRTDAWQLVLSGNYRAWEVPRRVAADFSARLRQVDLAGIKLVECVCGPCSGRRLPLQVRQDDEPHLAIQIVMAGAERFRVADETVSIGPGDALIWVSDRPMEFEVTERLHKMTLVVPLRALLERLPHGAALRPGLLDGRHGLGAVLFSHLRALGEEAELLDAGEMAAAKRATLELLSALLFRPAEASSYGLARQYLNNVQGYILDHLREEDLSPTRIAQANRISVRYLHILFEPTGRSVSAWIQEQRLQRCRETLEDPAFDGCKLADIAWQWGFKDASQFSRAFKVRFGRSPRDYRMPAPARMR
jgi:AraC-like DNA-binding protein